jgi:hypothetical protein
MNWTALLTGLVGAIFGACIAYFSDWLKEWRKRRNEQHGAIVRTQLALIGQFNTIRNLQKQCLDPLRDDPARVQKLIHFEMQDANLRVPYDSIAFLLSTDNPTLVLEIHAAEQAYLSALEGLRARNQAFNKLHSNSTLEAIDPKTGKCTVVSHDPRDIKLLEDTTALLYDTVDRARERLELQIKDLHKAGKALYPKRKFLQIAGEK